MGKSNLNKDTLTDFLGSDPKYHWRTLSAVAYKFGCDLAEVDAAIGTAPGSFTARTGRMGILIAVAGTSY